MGRQGGGEEKEEEEEEKVKGRRRRRGEEEEEEKVCCRSRAYCQAGLNTKEELILRLRVFYAIQV